MWSQLVADLSVDAEPTNALLSSALPKVLGGSGSLPPIHCCPKSCKGMRQQEETGMCDNWEGNLLQGREGTACVGWKKERFRKHAGNKKRSFWHSRFIEAASGCQGHVGEWDCVGWGDPDSAPDHLGIAGDAGLLSPLFMLYFSTSYARWGSVRSTWLLNTISLWQVSRLTFWQCL